MPKPKTKTESKPEPLSAAEIIERSGHTHHSKAVKVLRDLGWRVTVSPYYSDNFTDKPREIDIIADKRFPFEGQVINTRTIGDVAVRLFIECKYILSSTVIWFDQKDAEEPVDLVCRSTGWAKEVLLAHGSPFHHHYLEQQDVAKLIASGQGRSDENEAFARAINQTLNGLISYRQRRRVTQVSGTDRTSLGSLTFPIILLNSFDLLHRTEMSDTSTVKPITQPFQIEVNYAYKAAEASWTEYFLVDTVDLTHLPSFLASLEAKEVESMKRNIERKQYR